MTHSIVLLGCGNMGRTYAEGWVQARLIHASELGIIDHSPEKVEDLKRQGYTRSTTNPDVGIGSADILVLAVKPQDFQALIPQLRPLLNSGQLLLSVMAGVNTQFLQSQLGLPKVVRAMPNLPAKIGLGITAFTASAEVSREELLVVQNLLGINGKTLYVNHEDQVDAATAISGSGPGYVFYLMDAMIQAALNHGFNQAQAKLLVQETFAGAAQLLQGDTLSPAEWIARVASRGGTTEAALSAFEQNGLDRILQAGVEAAYLRARELSGAPKA